MKVKWQLKAGASAADMGRRFLMGRRHVPEKAHASSIY